MTSACQVQVPKYQWPDTSAPTKLSTTQIRSSLTTIRKVLVLSHSQYHFVSTQDKMPPKAAQPREFVHPEASHARKM